MGVIGDHVPHHMEETKLQLQGTEPTHRVKSNRDREEGIIPALPMVWLFSHSLDSVNYEVFLFV